MTSEEGDEPLCFTALATKRNNNEISTQAYLESILAHCRGVRHGPNKKCNDNDVQSDHGHPVSHEMSYSVKLGCLDRLTWRLRDWALKLETVSGTKPSLEIVNRVLSLTSSSLPDTSTLLLALTAYLCRDVLGFQTSLDEIDSVYGTTSTPRDSPPIRRSLCRTLVFQAVREGNLDMLPLLLQEKLHFEEDTFTGALSHDGSGIPNGAEVLRLLSEAGYKLPKPPSKWQLDPNHPLNAWA
jgi:hypothetical protein